MNQTWKDIEGKEHKVEDAHKHNQLLINFNYIQDQLKEYLDNYIKRNVLKKVINISNYTLLFSLEY